MNLAQVQAAAQAGRIKWRYHAVIRSRQRRIALDQIRQVLKEGEILEQRPRARPFPKCLMMAMVEPSRPLYVAVAYEQASEYLYVITAHWLDPRKWEDPWTRKPKQP